MDTLSLTTFVDFVTKSGTPKLTIVRNFKHQPPYDPKTDFYKAIREAIVSGVAAKDLGRSALDGLLTKLADPKKTKAYAALVKGYKKFLGSKNIAVCATSARVWSHGDLEIRVNPEVGLLIDAVPHIVKLYLKDPEPKKNQVLIICQLMRECFAGGTTAPVCGVLDVRTGRLHTPTVPVPGLDVLLRGEAAAFESIYKAV